MVWFYFNGPFTKHSIYIIYHVLLFSTKKVWRYRKYKLPLSNQSSCTLRHQNRNKSWKQECVLSFNMDWWILVNVITRFWLGIKYYSLMFSWQVQFLLAKKVLLKLQGSRGWQKINNRSHLCAVHLDCAQQMTHISQDDIRSIIALCDLCPKIHVFMFFL